MTRSTTIHVGNALDVLSKMPSESVHCCVTSPPYWGLRSYEGGAGMIGLEPTFDEHLENLVAVFREVRRVLRDDASLWLNYGDAYATGDANRKPSKADVDVGGWQSRMGDRRTHSDGLKPKDLMMMPSRVAMALQADGWWLRSEIIWHKPNPMPESVTDRPTNAHEKLFLLTKSAKYFYDAEAVRKPSNGWAGDFKPKCPERMEAQKFGGTRNEHNQATANPATSGPSRRTVSKRPTSQPSRRIWSSRASRPGRQSAASAGSAERRGPGRWIQSRVARSERATGGKLAGKRRPLDSRRKYGTRQPDGRRPAAIATCRS